MAHITKTDSGEKDMKTVVTNPVLRMDYPDPEVIRVGDSFYMTTTSTHFMPGVPIMKSKDLKNWEVISYLYDTFSDCEAHKLENGKSIYGAGAWATSMRYHKGKYYVCFNCNDRKQTYIYCTENIEDGVWQRSVIKGMHHDPSLLFDTDGRVYLVYGNGTIWIQELEENCSDIRQDGIHQILIDTPQVEGLNCEGSHFQYIDGKYYLFLIQWPKGRRRIQWCYRSDTLLGAYEGRILLDDCMEYGNEGVAQGGVFDTPAGEWYAMLFQDRGAVGRCPVLVRVTWKDGWPELGRKGKVEKQLEVDLEENLHISKKGESKSLHIPQQMDSMWEWNHNPDKDAFSVAERKGWLRLKNKNPASELERARNILTLRTIEPWCCGEVLLDTEGMKENELAGCAAFQNTYGYIGIRIGNSGARTIVQGICEDHRKDGTAIVREESLEEIKGKKVYLRIIFDFRERRDRAWFEYSEDNEIWKAGKRYLQMNYQLEHFAGYRFALFSFGEENQEGYADFQFLAMEQKEK